ncbi:MAG: exonuclease domain-containing protein [Woeseiaceae bacterium]|nr:exonuclease domain-containing protein [Woeseiaceae bacterium]
MADLQPDIEFDQSLVGQERRVRDLPTFYYHGHFVEMLGFVGDHYAHVLDEPHHRFLDDYKALGHEAQCLYVRLANRKGRVFAGKGLRYPELGELPRLLDELRETDWLGAPQAEHFGDLLGHLNRGTLLDILSLQFAGLGRSMKKADLVEFARTNCEPGRFVDALLATPAGRSLHVQRRAEEVRFLSFLYFGKVQDGLSQFTMRDLGLVRVHDFREAFEARFQDRDEALEHYFFATRLKAVERADVHELQRLAAEVPRWPVPQWPAAATLRDKLAERLGARLEKAGAADLALEVYRQGESAKATERVVRLLFASDRRDEAKAFLERCIELPRSDEEQLFASDLYARKFNAKRTSTLTDTLRAGETIDIDESQNGAPERAAAAYFERQGARAFRAENALWRTFFGVLFWDSLFASDTASLHSPFEFLPSSLSDGSFRESQRESIDARLALLDDAASLKRELLKVSTRHYGTANGVFRWRRSILDALFEFVDVADADAMRAMLERIASDYKSMRYGYPDLLVIEAGRPRFVEIKTDGDSLRRNQLLKLEQLKEAGFAADVVRIRWTLDPEQVYVVVDVETTGGKGENHRVTEVGAVKVRNGEVIDRYSTLVNPQRTIPAGITRLTGISAEMVADAPYFADIADAFAEFMGDAIFVAHNVDFDYRFISAEFRRLGRRFRHPKLCTCASMRKLYPGHRSYALNSLCAEYDISLKQHHRALCDAEAAAELLLLINEKRAEQPR